MAKETNTEIYHVPDDILFNILSKFPTKSLCRSKCLSKLHHSMIENPIFHKTRPKIPLQWTSLPPKQHLAPDNGDTVLHIYSVDDNNEVLIDNNEVSTVVRTYKPPLSTFFLRQYKGLICSYSRSSQLTLFNTLTQDSVTVSFPVRDEYINDLHRNFEYGFDPLSKKYKVFAYRFENQLWNFEVLTLGEESPTWRPVKNPYRINSFSDWVTIVDGRLFWFDDYVNEFAIFDYPDSDCESEPPQIISFNFTKEELTRITVPGKEIFFDYDPLFEFEGSLCFAETVNCTLEQISLQWELNVWMLNDIDNSRWTLMKRISLPLSGTNLRTTRTKKCPAMEETVEFSAQNGELLIAVCDDISQYVFSYNFLNDKCKRVKIIGEPFCKRMQIIGFQSHASGTDSDDDDMFW
ncbi:hypothetical protein ACHQM5_009662 [Ranunculus cassubicifolius]